MLRQQKIVIFFNSWAFFNALSHTADLHVQHTNLLQSRPESAVCMVCNFSTLAWIVLAVESINNVLWKLRVFLDFFFLSSLNQKSLKGPGKWDRIHDRRALPWSVMLIFYSLILHFKGSHRVPSRAARVQNVINFLSPPTHARNTSTVSKSSVVLICNIFAFIHTQKSTDREGFYWVI
jgi:hypothetical protein